MLHNTGPYGPNEGQVNMGAPVNMSQIPGTTNISHSLNNFSKISQPPPHSPGGQFLLPDYSGYGQLPQSMNAQMHQYQGYHHIGFHQNYPSQTHPIHPNMHWNNGMMPMNLNLQSEHSSNADGFHQNIEKRHLETFKDPPNSKIMPLNIPQIQTKAFQKHGNEVDNYYNDNYNNYYDSNLDLRVRNHEKIHIDETRRKSLENTVKLIENILINTTSKREAHGNKQESRQTEVIPNRQLMAPYSNTEFKPTYNLQQAMLAKQMANQAGKQPYNLETFNTKDILNINSERLNQERKTIIDHLQKDMNSTKDVIQENTSKHTVISSNVLPKHSNVYHDSYLQKNNSLTNSTTHEKAIFTNNKHMQDNDNQFTNKISTEKNKQLSTDKSMQEGNTDYVENKSQESALNFTSNKHIKETDNCTNNEALQETSNFSVDKILLEKYKQVTNDIHMNEMPLDDKNNLQEKAINSSDDENLSKNDNINNDHASTSSQDSDKKSDDKVEVIIDKTLYKSNNETKDNIKPNDTKKNDDTIEETAFSSTFELSEIDKNKQRVKTADILNTIQSRICDNNKRNAVEKDDNDLLGLSDILPDHDSNTFEDMETDINEANAQEAEHDPLEDSDDTNESEEDIKPNINEICKDNGIVAKVDVKIEKDDEDDDIDDPFLKDPHGLTKDNIEEDCDIIDMDKSVEEAKAAIKNGQSTSLYYECPHCNLLLKNPKRFLIHAKWHSFGLTQTLKDKLKREKEMRRYERREARVIENMNSKEVTETENISGKVYPCIECDKVFSTKTSLKNHRTRFHPPRGRDCRICHTPITGWKAMRAHMATHVIQTSDGYRCTECPKMFKYMHSLVKHQGTHMEKTHPCPECPKMFGSEILVKMHMKSHERAQRGTTFRCTYCGKGFFEAYNLAVHERTHRNERPFSCDICGTSFGTKSSLKRHLKVSHNALKPFECSECHRFFVTEAIRDRHHSRNHGKPEDFKFPCELCDCKYLKLKDLQKHEYKIHPRQTLNKRKRKPRTSKIMKMKLEEDQASD